MYVVDASLAVKWIFWEHDSAEALAFWNAEAGNLCAPDLLVVEMASAIVRRGNIDKALHQDMAEALSKCARLFAGNSIQLFRDNASRIITGGRMALQIGHPVKDCLYLFLAMELDCSLITCDAKFASKAQQLWPRVEVFREGRSSR